MPALRPAVSALAVPPDVVMVRESGRSGRRCHGNVAADRRSLARSWSSAPELTVVPDEGDGASRHRRRRCRLRLQFWRCHRQAVVERPGAGVRDHTRVAAGLIGTDGGPAAGRDRLR